MQVLVTGVAGFIGFFVTKRLLHDGHTVIGIDNLNNYYDITLKKDRLTQLLPHQNFIFKQLDLADRENIMALFEQEEFGYIIHLAAQAGVRHSLENPFAYSESNLGGFLNILEGCRHSSIKHLIFASSSSVYGASRKVPFSVSDSVDYPVSLYAATKKANELMAHAYSHLYGFPATGLRFFTVYGPWGRPDMAYFKFVDAIAKDHPISVYNHGQMQRDFTYIDDVVEGIVRLLVRPQLKTIAEREAQNSQAHFKIYNIGNNRPVSLLKFIEIVESLMGKKADKIMQPMQPGDVTSTCADVDELMRDVGFKPSTSLEDGMARFVAWYTNRYGA
jgi:UDP-glucuronate 4-epimerase